MEDRLRVQAEEKSEDQAWAQANLLELTALKAKMLAPAVTLPPSDDILQALKGDVLHHIFESTSEY